MRIKLFVVLFILFHIGANAQKKKRCANSLIYDDQRSDYKSTVNKINEQARISAIEKDSGKIFEIPVVVHVIHDNESGEIGGESNKNISKWQILTQIKTLNEDFRKIKGTNGYNEHPDGSDTKIEFFLAGEDPEGNYTNGITRHYTPKSEFHYSDEKEIKSYGFWPGDEYLNIWVCDIKDNFLGFSQFPDSSGLKGLKEDNGSYYTDGMVIDYTAFGRNTGTVQSGNYSYGRTVTHEMGHFLGLVHPWGNSVGCNSDYCDDTPPVEEPNRHGCEDEFSDCSDNGIKTRNMIENYMDYSPDICMNIFTKCQAKRMRHVLCKSPRRKTLVESGKNMRKAIINGIIENKNAKNNLTNIVVYPNPADEYINVKFQEKIFSSLKIVGLYNQWGKKVLEKRLKRSMDKVKININNIPSGLYLLKVNTRNYNFSEKIHIN